MTHFMFHISADQSMANFAFFGTIVGYNFVKYDLWQEPKTNAKRVKIIAVLSLFSSIGVGYYFSTAANHPNFPGVLGLTLLYTSSNRRNARNWAGVKIYIVALCWVGALVLPVNAYFVRARFLSKMCSTFYIGFVLILILKFLTWLMILTYIQYNRRVRQNCWFVIVASILFFRFFKTNFIEEQLIVNLVLVLLLRFIILHEKKIQLLHFLWVESIPILVADGRFLLIKKNQHCCLGSEIKLYCDL
jgi:hypothetical protein